MKLLTSKRLTSCCAKFTEIKKKTSRVLRWNIAWEKVVAGISKVKSEKTWLWTFARLI